MAKPELGTKRLCGSCAAKFYDLSKDPITCPKCGKPVHIRAKEHACGWKADVHADTPSAIIRRIGAKKKTAKVAAGANAAGITMADIQAVKDVVNKLGADTVRQLAEVLEK